MQNFVFHNPTKIIFGQDTIKAIGAETVQLGTRALLVYGRNSIKLNGIHQQVTTSLAEAGIQIVEYPGVKSNPVLSHVQSGIALAREAGVDVVVAVGGGSVLDSAKAIAAGAMVEHNVWKFFTGKKGVKSALPLATVLTLAASGSEMNGGMVLTNEETGQKYGTANRFLNPKVSILDPTATFSVPADYTAYGAVDAIAHMLEFYFTTPDPRTPVQDRLIEGLVGNIMTSCEQVLADPLHYQARAELMWAATLALNGLTAAGMGAAGFPMHMIEHSLSALYDVAHGAGLSVVIPGWLKWQAGQNPNKIAQFAEEVFGVGQGSTIEKAEAGISRLKSWFEKVNSPTTLEAIAVPESDISRIAANATGLAKIWRMREYSQEIIEEILQHCR